MLNTCRSESKELKRTNEKQNVCRRKFASTFSPESRGRLINHSYSNPSDMDNTLLCNTSHPFSTLSIHLRLARVREHICGCKDTCGTLAAIHEAGSGTYSRCTYRICLLSADEEGEILKPSKHKSYWQQQCSTHKHVFWS